MLKENLQIDKIKSEIFNISNSLSIFRLLLTIPTAILLYNSYYITAFILMVISAISDYLDGYFARKWNQVTEIGKIIDPIADKIFIGVIVIIVYLQNIVPLWYLILVISRDVLILLGGLVLSKRIKKIPVSNCIGKIAVLMIGITLSIHILDIDLKEISLGISSALIVISFLNYFFEALKNINIKK